MTPYYVVRVELVAVHPGGVETQLGRGSTVIAGTMDQANDLFTRICKARDELLSQKS